MNNIFDNNPTDSGNLLDDSLTQTQNLDPLENSYDSSLPDIQPAPLDTAMDNMPDQSMNTTFDSAQPDDSLYHSSIPHNSTYNSISFHSTPVEITNTPLPVTIVDKPSPIDLSNGGSEDQWYLNNGLPDSSEDSSSCYGGESSCGDGSDN